MDDDSNPVRTHTRAPGVYGPGYIEDTESDSSDDEADSESRDPTHRCTVCSDYEKYIESAPTSDYQWCPNCERVTRMRRLDQQI